MAVVLSDSSNASYDGNLSTANGLYRVETYNLGCFSTTTLVLSSTRTISVTFANAGNCQGLILILTNGYAGGSTPDKSVMVELLEGTTVRASKTLTANEISNSTTIKCGNFIVPFVFTSPYAVTNAAATWSFRITQPAGGTYSWYIRTSNGTAPFYAAWCNNQVSFNNNDVLIVKDALVIDQSATLVGLLSTGDTTRSICCVICRNTDPTPDNVSLLTWDSTPAASYTLTLDGIMIIGAHSGFRVGTPYVFTVSGVTITPGNGARYTNNSKTFYVIDSSISAGSGTLTCLGSGASGASGDLTKANWNSDTAVGDATVAFSAVTGNPIPYAQQAIITIDTTPTNGSAGNSGISSVCFNLYYDYRGSLFLYGQIPFCERTQLAGNYNTGATAITSTDVTGWTNGMEIWIGGQDVKTVGERKVYTVSSTSTTTINIGALTTSNRKTNGLIMTRTGYGILLQANAANNSYYLLRNQNFSNFVIAGVDVRDVAIYGIYSGDTPNSNFDDSANRSKHRITHCAWRQYYAHRVTITEDGMDITYVNTYDRYFINYFVSTPTTIGYPTTLPGTLLIDQCWCCDCSNNDWRTYFQSPIVITNCKFDTMANALIPSGFNQTITDCDFQNCANAIATNVSILGNWSNCVFNNCSNAIYITGYNGGGVVGIKATNFSFGQTRANTYDISVGIMVHFDMELISPVGNVSVYPNYLTSCIDKSQLRMVSYNTAAGDDRMYTPYGYIFRTVVSDPSTARTGTDCLRFQPISGTYLLHWDQTVQTGSLEDMPVTVSVWVKINSSNYYGGAAHINPTLRVTYDNTTDITSVATDSTSWQQLSVSFSPTTTYGEIIVRVEGATDQATTSAYFYVDDFKVDLPTGMARNYGKMDYWMHGLPITALSPPRIGGAVDGLIAIGGSQ